MTMIDSNGYSLPNPGGKKRSNLMAAYPVETSILDRGQGTATRDFDLSSNTYPRKSWNYKDINVNYAKTHNNNTVDPRLIRGILRNKDEYSPVNRTINQILDESCDETEESEANYAQLPRRRRRIRSGVLDNAFQEYVRPALAEFLSVLFAVFTVTFTEASLQQLLLERITRIFVVAMADALCLLVCTSTFQNCKIHLNPAITLGALFAGDTKPLLCFIYWAVQIVAATLGVFLYQVVTIDGSPVSAGLLHSQSDLWLTEMYKLVLCQTIATAMLVMSYLTGLGSNVCSENDSDERTDVFIQNSANMQKFCGLSSAVMLTSFISLLSSTASWNPVRSTAISIAASLHQSSLSVWQYHYVFWLGPVIGSLFASFFYRLIFAAEDHRIATCTSNFQQEYAA